jgi:hypothetical protein
MVLLCHNEWMTWPFLTMVQCPTHFLGTAGRVRIINLVGFGENRSNAVVQ